MLEVGCHGGLSFFEARSHFSAWSIVSSPLVLSMDVNDDAVMDQVWEILSDFNMQLHGQVIPHTSQVPSWQFFYKPVGAGKIVVLLMNHDSKAQDLVLNFADVPGLQCTKCQMRCLYVHSDLGVHDGSFTAKGVPSHDSRMFMISVPSEVVFM
eukprot:g30900.t1